jgi:hypothetical protein
MIGNMGELAPSQVRFVKILTEAVPVRVDRLPDGAGGGDPA